MPTQTRSSHNIETPLDLSTLNERINTLAHEMAIREDEAQDTIRAQDEKLDHMMTMLERMSIDLRKSVIGKGTDQGQHSGTTAQPVVPEHGGAGDINNEDSGGLFEGGQQRGSDHSSVPKVFLPRLDLPSFVGTKPNDWPKNCKFYFEYYQTPERYKVQLATMNFSNDAEEWFSCFRMEHPDPPWPILVDVVFERFRERTHMNPCAI
jgi:hypothetical protein